MEYYGLDRTSFGSEDSESPWIAGTMLLRNNNSGNGKRANIASLSRKVLISSIRQLDHLTDRPAKNWIRIGAIAQSPLQSFFTHLLYRLHLIQKSSDQLDQYPFVSGSESEQKLDLAVGLQITNTNEFTLTTSNIAYDLFADGSPVDQIRYHMKTSLLMVGLLSFQTSQ